MDFKFVANYFNFFIIHNFYLVLFKQTYFSIVYVRFRVKLKQLKSNMVIGVLINSVRIKHTRLTIYSHNGTHRQRSLPNIAHRKKDCSMPFGCCLFLFLIINPVLSSAFLPESVCYSTVLLLLPMALCTFLLHRDTISGGIYHFFGYCGLGWIGYHSPGKFGWLNVLVLPSGIRVPIYSNYSCRPSDYCMKVRETGSRGRSQPT